MTCAQDYLGDDVRDRKRLHVLHLKLEQSNWNLSPADIRDTFGGNDTSRKFLEALVRLVREQPDFQRALQAIRAQQAARKERNVSDRAICTAREWIPSDVERAVASLKADAYTRQRAERSQTDDSDRSDTPMPAKRPKRRNDAAMQDSTIVSPRGTETEDTTNTTRESSDLCSSEPPSVPSSSRTLPPIPMEDEQSSDGEESDISDDFIDRVTRDWQQDYEHVKFFAACWFGVQSEKQSHRLRGLPRLKSKQTLLFIPACLHHHWTLVVVDLQRGGAAHYDSLNNSPQRLETIRHNLLAIFQDDIEIRNMIEGLVSKDCPQQKDSHSCGLFVLETMRRLLESEPIPKTYDVDSLRELFSCYQRHQNPELPWSVLDHLRHDRNHQQVSLDLYEPKFHKAHRKYGMQPGSSMSRTESQLKQAKGRLARMEASKEELDRPPSSFHDQQELFKATGSYHWLVDHEIPQAVMEIRRLEVLRRQELQDLAQCQEEFLEIGPYFQEILRIKKELLLAFDALFSAKSSASRAKGKGVANATDDR